MRHERPPRSGDRPDDAIRFELVSKSCGGSRSLIHLGDHDRRRYEAAVASVIPAIERALTRGAVANRARLAPLGIELEPWRLARRRYVRSLRAASKGPSRAAFVGDVRDCYGSITPATVERALHVAGASSGHVERVAALLHNFELRGVRGLPIGPPPSAVLANAVLAPVDDALGEAADGPAYRWVDDVVVFTRNAAAGRRTAAAFDRALEALGLSANAQKCTIVDDPSMLLPRAARSPYHGPRDMA